jgi:nucleoside-diphosphate-sugar epimerase
VNVDGTKELLNDAKHAGVKRFVFASTCSNYGRIDGNTVADETVELRPISLYAETKVTGEMEVLNGSNGLVTTCLRFATVYGHRRECVSI